MDKDMKKARGIVEEFLGIELTLIELVELKKFVKKADRLRRLKCSDMRNEIPSIGGLAALDFLNNNYGTQIYHQGDFHEGDFRNYLYNHEAGYDARKEYFKRMQDEMHNNYFPLPDKTIGPKKHHNRKKSK